MEEITPTTSTSARTKRAEYNRAYYESRKEELQARQRAYYHEHKANPRWSKERQREARKRYYVKRKRQIAEMRSKPCADCGGKFPVVCMDFHHPSDDKELSIGRSASVALERLEAEIAKCIVLCANCHRIRHHAR